MSKRKPAASKHARSHKIASRAQRAAQDVVRSAKSSPPLETTKSPKNLDHLGQEALLAENSLKEAGYQKTMTDSSSEVSVFSLAMANVQAYQAKLQEMAESNMQFSFEFARKLATVGSLLEIPSVLTEFTSKWMGMVPKYSKEMAELSIKPS